MEKRKKDLKYLIEIIARYAILLLVPVLSFLFLGDFMAIFYAIFWPLTVYPAKFILGFFYQTLLVGDFLIVGNFATQIIDACIAGSAYFLLFILVMTTFGISLLKRIKMILFAFALLLLMNIARIILMIVLGIASFGAFDIAHKLFWYGLSTIYVVFIWILSVWLFKIKEIPVYSDIKFLISIIKKK